jgi:hypothetical protein
VYRFQLPSSLKLRRGKATQHIEAPTKAKKYPYWITKAGFVVKVNFLGRDCNFRPVSVRLGHQRGTLLIFENPVIHKAQVSGNSLPSPVE